MGLELVNFQIKSVNDGNHYYESIATVDIAKKRQEKREATAQEKWLIYLIKMVGIKHLLTN